MATLNGMCLKQKYEVLGRRCDVCVALLHTGAATPAQRIWFGPLSGFIPAVSNCFRRHCWRDVKEEFYR